MGSLGLPEIIFILVIALLIFGPKRLPEIGRTLGKGMAEFRKATNELKNTITTELTIEDEQHPIRPRRVDMASVTPLITPPEWRPQPAETVPQGAPASDPYQAPPPEASAAVPAPSAPDLEAPGHPAQPVPIEPS